MSCIHNHNHLVYITLVVWFLHYSVNSGSTLRLVVSEQWFPQLFHVNDGDGRLRLSRRRVRGLLCVLCLSSPPAGPELLQPLTCSADGPRLVVEVPHDNEAEDKEGAANHYTYQGLTASLRGIEEEDGYGKYKKIATVESFQKHSLSSSCIVCRYKSGKDEW